ncbi:small ribosomal subunit Rsm22 family protein [Mesorhizobium yinganensis]|uniref:small ribosomal subunit Rsm22 family protein n=1 Tax=Mesorhizobium yinganensis TaxID=3157707 RepID=UPI0032B76BFE
MELPTALRQAVDRLLERTPLADLQRASGILSARYRAELRDGRPHLDGALAVKAYLATRLPATYAAVRATFASVADGMPDFSPASLLDIGAGPGTAFWSAADCWPSLNAAVLVEASAAARSAGETLGREKPAMSTRWLADDATRGLPDLAPADLVTLCYVLDELDPAQRAALVERLWALTAGVLVIVEPGTPAGWQRILAARDRLIAAGAHLVAPCPHENPCPLAPPEWCHFSRRVARSRLHRMAKGGDVPWEDEKYIFVAAARQPARPPRARVIAPPRGGKGLVTLKLCQADGSAAELKLSKRDGDNFRIARRLDWGDAVQQDFAGSS